MRLRFPLYARILVWFFLNLALLGALGVAFIRIHFQVGLDSVVMREAEGRIHAVSRLIGEELRDAPQSDWTAILARFGNAYGLTFYLFRGDGTQIAGAPVTLPGAVQNEIKTAADRRPPRGDRVPEDEMGPRPRRRPPPPDGPPSPPGPTFFRRSDEPTQYWIGIRLPGVEAPGRRSAPMTLLAMSPTLRGGNFFLDPTPWLILALAGLLVSVLFWLPLVHGITRSIARMTRATERIAEGQFDIQLQVNRSDELGRLGGAINQMAARLAGFVAGQKRFLGDIAHELCSPIARAEVGLGILEQRSEPAQQVAIQDVREDVEQMSALVHELLSFSKASLGAATIKLQRVNARVLVDEIIAREAPAGANIENHLPADFFAQADVELLRRAVGNVIRNAIRYAAQAGPITISGRQERETAILAISDCGPGVPENALDKLFDPFYRVDDARARETGGVGLGLTIVKSCLEANGGTVRCRNREGGGFEVEIRLKTVLEG